MATLAYSSPYQISGPLISSSQLCPFTASTKRRVAKPYWPILLATVTARLIVLSIPVTAIPPTLPLHPLKTGEEYYLGVFLVGAYQEILGDLHNLFGDTNVVSVRLNRDGSYDFVKEIHGDTIADVLSYVEYSPQQMQLRHRNTAERAVKEGRISARERQQIIKAFNASMQGYTYYEKEEH